MRSPNCKISKRPYIFNTAILSGAFMCLNDVRWLPIFVSAPAGPDRLQRRFRRELRRIGEIEHRPDLRPQRPIFGKETSRLAHQPDRRRVDPRPVEDGEDGSVWVGHGRSARGSRPLR